ncbi:MAG TPA: efflux RND transporter periplasmic adaptor subunit, partial [Chloroflexota bacterium]|nr:efflux RND transporter periplasmic adaptor subunit [Chloroflexota bacterium]
QAHLDQMVGGPSDEDLQQAQSIVDQASQQVTLATSPTSVEELRAQRAAVAQARLQLQKARQPFTSFDLQQQEQAVAQAQAMLDKAQHPFTDQDHEAAQAAVDQANAQVAQVELALRDATVVAPVDGRVAERLAAPGALVGPTTPIVTLVPPALELIVNVEESQLGNLAQGQVVQFGVPAVADATFNGAVSSIAPNVDARTRTAAVRIQPEDPAGQLRAGMSATASIVTATHRGTLLVPRAAVKSNGREASPTLLVIDADSRVRFQPVRLGLQADDSVEVTQGLNEGDRVATSNLTDLQAGDLVAPRVAPPTTASAALSN